MKVLVTGGAGFIASYITDELISRKHEVAVIDNLTHGNISNLNSNAQFYKMDIRNKNILTIFKNFKPDVLIHHAAQINTLNSIKYPIYDADVNIIGSINLLEACRKYNVKKIIYPSSAAIFGEPEYLPIDELHPVNMISGYGVSKYTVENYIKVYKHLYNINYTILRYSNVYGKRQDSSSEGGVVSIFLNKILNDQNPVIFGSGNQTRDFIYVKDIVKANMYALESHESDIYNVCTGVQTSINTLYKVINNLLGKNINPEYKPSKNGDIKNSFMSYQKIKKQLNFKPDYDIFTGIKDMLYSK